jgi:hypothetical protein
VLFVVLSWQDDEAFQGFPRYNKDSSGSHTLTVYPC